MPAWWFSDAPAIFYLNKEDAESLGKMSGNWESIEEMIVTCAQQQSILEPWLKELIFIRFVNIARGAQNDLLNWKEKHTYCLSFGKWITIRLFRYLDIFRVLDRKFDLRSQPKFEKESILFRQTNANFKDFYK